MLLCSLGFLHWLGLAAAAAAGEFRPDDAPLSPCIGDLLSVFSFSPSPRLLVSSTTRQLKVPPSHPTGPVPFDYCSLRSTDMLQRGQRRQRGQPIVQEGTIGPDGEGNIIYIKLNSIPSRILAQHPQVSSGHQAYKCVHMFFLYI